MTPYAFYMLSVNTTKEPYNTKRVASKLPLAKKTLNHLYNNKWTDSDIVILIHKMCDTLRNAYVIPTFSYICGILLKNSSRPIEKTESIEVPAHLAEWARKEIERLSKEL
jgi:hypothetical protein